MVKEINKKVLKSIRKLDEDLDAKSQTVIEIVQFNDYPPQLIKQEYYKDKDSDEWCPGKFKGFTYDDLKFLKKQENRDLLFKKLKPKKKD